MHRSRQGLARWVRRVLGFCLLVVAMAPVVAPSAHADPWAELKKAQQNLDKLKQEKAAVDNAYTQTERQMREAQYLLNKTQAELSIAQNSLAEVQSLLNLTQEQLKKVEGELKVAEDQYARRQRLLFTRVRALNEEGPVKYISVLLGSTSFSDFISRVSMLKIVVTKDAELFRSIREEKAALETRRAQVATRRDELTSLRAQAQVRAAEVQAKVAQTQQQTATLAQLKRNLQNRLSEIDREEEKMQEQVAELQRQLARKAGKFAPIWPLRSIQITDNFGMRWHPILGTYRPHNGIDLAANTGDPVFAVEDGWVIVSGYNTAFGNLVVIDHGNGVSTWYAHNSRLLTWVGQQVKAGQQISAAGSTGWSTGPHLHFEIRIHGKPVNPLDYLPR